MKGSYSLRADVFTNFAGQESREIRWIFQSKGCRAVLQSRSTREVLILIEHLIHDIRVTISPSALSPHNYVLQSLQHFTKMITDKSQTKPTTERLNINQVISTRPHIGVIVHQGSSFQLLSDGPFFFVTYCYNSFIVYYPKCPYIIL